ncbi:uncharacterized protein AB9W97_002662 [Spinachia spinachia]
MSNHSVAVRSTTPPFSNTSASEGPSVFDEIAANDLTSRANYIYSLLAVLGFIAGCFLLYTVIQTYRAQRRLAWLDRLLWAFCVLQVLLLLLSLHAAAYRPHYLIATGLGCAALSFAINTTSLCSLLVLVLMAYVLSLDPPSHALLRRPGVSAALVILTSVLASVLLAGLRGLTGPLQEEGRCFMDPFEAGATYAAARLCLTSTIPLACQAGLLVGGCVRQRKTKGRFLSGSEEGPVFLAVALVVSSCQLFYGVALVRGARLHQAAQPEKEAQWERAFLSVAELVLFSGSGASLLLVLLVHRPCREGLLGAFRQLSDCCGGRGRTQPHRNIIAPHIEITDRLQDIEDEGSSRTAQLF